MGKAGILDPFSNEEVQTEIRLCDLLEVTQLFCVTWKNPAQILAEACFLPYHSLNQAEVVSFENM